MDFFLATNNGDIGGGEVMLLNIARAARALGHRPTIVGPVQPSELLEAAQDEGFSTISLPAHNRKAYMAQLRAWRIRNRQSLLWCNGLVPALATAGLGPRIVHLHQLPQGNQRYACWLAQRKALATLVPSSYVAERVRNSTVFENWVGEVPPRSQKREPLSPVRVGFLGRPSPIKGTHTLARAIALLNQESEREYRLVIGGEAKFIGEEGQQEVQKELATLGDKVSLLGWVTPQKLFEESDLLVVPSEVEESFGLVAAEAMSAHQPLIVSEAGALTEVVGEAHPWRFQAGKVEELAETIREVANALEKKEDEALANATMASYWRWYENYSPQAGKARVQKLLESLSNADGTAT